MRHLLAACLILAALAAACAYRTLPLTEPAARLEPVASVPEPDSREVGAWWAFTKAEFFYPLKHLFDVPFHLRWALGVPWRAMDVDAFDEVPDSNWFTNRNTVRPLSADQIERGAGPPPASGTWTITGGKKGGIQPGFEIMDAAGRRYIMKLDVAEYPEMATAAEVIADRFYFAAGYDVPGATIATFSPERLRIAPGATYVTDDGFTCRLTPEALQGILDKAPRSPEGLYRAAAVNYVEGKLKGPFTYLGTRADDANDVIPHQHRRELRALLVVSSFLNNPDLIQANTLDSYVTEGGKSFLRHHLIDFGNSLGSYAFIYKPRRSGHEYAIDWGLIGARLFSLGAYSPRYEGEPLDVRPEIGFIDTKLFSPGAWKPEFPNPAFDYMTPADAFWGARIVASFSDDQVRAAVRAARLSDPASEDYLVRTLIRRRDAVGRYWFSRVSPLTGFALVGAPAEQALAFRDLAVEHFWVPSGAASYEVKVMDTDTVLRLPAGKPVPLTGLKGVPTIGEFALEIAAKRAGEEPLPPVRLKLRRDEAGFQLLGVEHQF